MELLKKTVSKSFSVIFLRIGMFNDDVCLCSVAVSCKSEAYICFLTRIFTSPTKQLRTVVFAWPPV